MIKKILLFTILFVWFFSIINVYAEITKEEEAAALVGERIAEYEQAQENSASASDAADLAEEFAESKYNIDATSFISDVAESNVKASYEAENASYEAEDAARSNLRDAQNALHEAECAAWWSKAWSCIDKSNFKISVVDISPWLAVGWGTTKKNVDDFLWTTIQKMMIALWSVSFLIMTIWAWYMIIYTWQDELLSKWKSIFMSWIIALVAALSSYYLVAFLRYVLYN